MKVAILGLDGYLGWPLALYLIAKGHTICGIDSFSRRRRVKELGCDSLTPIEDWVTRKIFLLQMSPTKFAFSPVELGIDNYTYIKSFLEIEQPDAIVHLAEQPSAPWSMISADYAAQTQVENVIGTLHLLWAMHEVCPDAHLIKLGTMGEYGVPDCDIPEGEIPGFCPDGDIDEYMSEADKLCPMQGLQFPRAPGSWYHLTKVHDTYNIIFACRNWNLRSTDIMQGPVFGVKIYEMNGDERLLTRFDYDEVFGTVINRFCAQAVYGHPLTVYGKGGQTRGYLPLRESMFCINAIIENPPEAGKYRTLNQFARTYTINDLASIVQAAGKKYDLFIDIKHYENPRKELETHYYNPHRQGLLDLGYKPTMDITEDVTKLIGDLLPYSDRIKEHLVIPRTRWDSNHRDSKVIE